MRNSRNIFYPNHLGNVLATFTDRKIAKSQTAIYEIKHSKRGAGIRKLIKEDPEDIVNVFKKILEDPGNAKTLLNELGDNVRWKVWGNGQFFKFYTKVGKKFETSVVIKALLDKAGDNYNEIKNCIEGLPVPPTRNMDDYEVFTGLQLKIGNTSDYFVADQVFVKLGKNGDGDTIISDIIIMETKLTDATKLSFNQGLAYENRAGSFSARTIKPKNIYNDTENYKEAFESINVEPTFIKCFDKAKGNEIDDFKLINSKFD